MAQGTPAISVLFNDGSDENCFALVIGGEIPGNLELLVVDSADNVRPVNNVPLRAPADYGAEGGGDTYHLA
jgi:hypothetical protein